MIAFLVKAYLTLLCLGFFPIEEKCRPAPVFRATTPPGPQLDQDTRLPPIAGVLAESPAIPADKKSKQAQVVDELLKIMNETRFVGTVQTCILALQQLRPLDPTIVPSLIRIGDERGVWAEGAEGANKQVGEDLRKLIVSILQNQNPPPPLPPLAPPPAPLTPTPVPITAYPMGNWAPASR